MSTFDEDDTFLARWLNNELTEAERVAFEQRPEYKEFKAIADQARDIKNPSYAQEDAWKRLKQSTVDQQPSQAKVRRLNPWRAIAASLALVLTAGAAWLWTGQTTVTTLAQQKQTIQLPDNSTVVLNSQSVLSYNSRLWSWRRTLTLEGEGYFEVTEGSSFAVNTSLGEVVVLGTSFNVYSRRTAFEVYCFTGSVAVQTTDESATYTLKPNETIRLQNQQGQKETFTTTAALDWRDGKTSYQSTNLGRVLNDLEDQFNIRIERSGIDVNLPFTGVFLHEDVDVALDMVLTPMGIRYERTGKVIRIK